MLEKAQGHAQLDDLDPAEEAALTRLSRDLKFAARTMDRQQARFIVDAYYTMQNDRIRANGQIRAMAQSQEPHGILMWLANQRTSLERWVASALDEYSRADPVGQWMRDVDGIGPVLAAGFLAHLDIERAPTASHFWRYAGLDPTVKWMSEDNTLAALEALNENANGDLTAEAVGRHFGRAPARVLEVMAKVEGQTWAKRRAALCTYLRKQPWNADLKLLCWKAGESFVKVSGKDTALYGKLYRQAKDRETERNQRGDFADQARHSLATKRYSTDTLAYAAYAKGALPDARIHLRAKRRAVKMFLAHLHHVMFEQHYKRPAPMPYVIEHGDEAGRVHAHYIPPPNWRSLLKVPTAQ